MPSKQSPFEDIVDLASKLSWKVNCLLALIAFLVLHGIASIKPEAPAALGQMGDFAVKQMIITLAMFGQLVLPFAFLVAAIVSAFRSHKRAKLYEETACGSDQNALFNMNWQEFEMLVEESFRRRGYAADRTGGNGPDGGVDIVLSKNGETYLVQCKQWKAQRLGVQPVRELHGVMAARRAVGGFMVCAGRFTDEAKAFAQHVNIRLIDGSMLFQMIAETLHNKTRSTSRVVEKPSCPACGAEMILRVARKGANAGKEFWGCSTYPQCNGTAEKS